MKRALLVLPLLLAVGCSHSDKRAEPSPTPSPTPSATAEPSPTASATPTRTAAPAPVGPVGTKVPSGFEPSSATFVSDSVGWVLGDSPCPTGKGRCDVIARTRDGGRTWRAIPSPRTSPDTLAQIRFADPANGFVSGDQLWATHDGGATWRVVPGVGAVQGIAAAAGRVWVLVEQELRSASAAGGAFVAEAGDVAAFALHGDRVVYTSMRGESKLYEGAHGGSGWDGVEVPCEGSETPVVALGSSSHWFLVCEGDAGLGHEDKTAFESQDGGATWKPAGDPPPNTGTDTYVTTDGTFVVDNQLVAVRRGGAWSTSLDTGGGIVEGGFESARLGFCIGGFGDRQDASMKLTRDAGRTWQDARF